MSYLDLYVIMFVCFFTLLFFLSLFSFIPRFHLPSILFLSFFFETVARSIRFGSVRL